MGAARRWLTCRRMNIALPLPDYVHAIGVDHVGLPVLPRISIKLEQDTVKWMSGVPMFQCLRCTRYLTHMHFHPPDLCEKAHARCYDCRSKPPAKKQGPDIRPRKKCIGLDGRIRFYCKLCGHYVTTSRIDPTRRTFRRSICDRCHGKEFVFNRKRADKYLRPCLRVSIGTRRRTAKTCSKCGGYSRSAVCAPCKEGAPPILGHVLRKRYGGAVPSFLFGCNAGSLFLERLRAKHTMPTNTPVRAKPTAQVKSSVIHPSWPAHPDIDG